MSERIVCNDNGEGGGVESITAKLREQAERIDLWAARQSEHGFSPISIDMRSEVDRIDGCIRELKDEINWLNAELHGAELEAARAYSERGAVVMTEENMAAHGWVRERTCRIKEDDDIGCFLTCSECGAIQPEDYTVYYCWSCGAKVVE